MKAALVISGDVKQIMLAPDNEEEIRILKSIQVTDNISVVAKSGSFTEKEQNYGYRVEKCRGGYLRAFEDDDCLMLVVEPKKNESNQSSES